MTFLAIAIVSLALIRRMPVSLMPPTEVPELVVEVSYPEGSPLYLERSIMQPLRTAFQGLYQLKEIESISASGTGEIQLKFEYGTDMKLAYIHANERVDRVVDQLPEDLDRPIVKRITAADIPAVRLQVTSEILDPVELSDFGRFIIRRRLEQVEGVSLVEMNGGVKKVMRITPEWEVLDRYDITDVELIQFIGNANLPLSRVKVADGNYEYDLTFDNLLNDPEAIYELKLPLSSSGSVPLDELVSISEGMAPRLGKHLFNGSEGLVFAIHKQESESFYRLKDKLDEVTNLLSKEYPTLIFNTTQDQYELLNESIVQLTVSIILGTLLAVLILFLFSGEYRSPLLMGVLIPLSLLASIAILRFLDQTINIVSLSGILLGIGILIDNGIILIDNINEKRKEHDLPEACRRGVQEIFPALISSTLTTLSVFIPLLLLGGTAGVLFQAQMISLSVVLFTSLLVAFALLPVAYYSVKPNPDKPVNIIFGSILTFYRKTAKSKNINFILGSFILLTFAGSIAFRAIPKQNLPEIQRNDLALSIQWEETLTLDENIRRIRSVVGKLHSIPNWEADIGLNNISEEGINHQNKALLYFEFKDHDQMLENKILLEKELERFPSAYYSFSRPKNPYDQLFDQEAFYAVYKLRTNGDRWIDPRLFREIDHPEVRLGEGFQYEPSLRLRFDRDKLERYGLSENKLIEKLKIHFNDQLVTRVNRVSESLPIVIKGSGKMTSTAFANLRVTVKDSISYPVSTFVSFENDQSLRYVRADLAGIYQDIKVKTQFDGWKQWDLKLREIASFNDILLSLTGEVTRIRENQTSLWISISLAILLLFVILTAQFESFKMPLIILAEIPVSSAGAILGLWISGQSLSIASLIGIIITLGIIVNDSILKVDTIRRYQKEGLGRNDAVKKAGEVRLKPILMTSLTTILALSPVLFGKGFGADVQFPLAIAVIFGLLVGTLCSVYLVPFLYRILIRDLRSV